MRREELYLADLIDNTRAVRGYLDGVSMLPTRVVPYHRLHAVARARRSPSLLRGHRPW
jgi:hypothetical protein